MKTGSAIILNTSFVTEVGIANFSVYSSAKSAVQSFIKTFAAELTEKGIRVGISPGHIKTNIYNNTGLNTDQINGAYKVFCRQYHSKDWVSLPKLLMPFYFLPLKKLHTFTGRN
jgi:NAD(P)-dependent dehydrogenase (short-subunit alcohol dehydrogenase family)